jgi:hypothetical protein
VPDSVTQRRIRAGHLTGDYCGLRANRFRTLSGLPQKGMEKGNRTCQEQRSAGEISHRLLAV